MRRYVLFNARLCDSDLIDCLLRVLLFLVFFSLISFNEIEFKNSRERVLHQQPLAKYSIKELGTLVHVSIEEHPNGIPRMENSKQELISSKLCASLATPHLYVLLFFVVVMFNYLAT